MNYYLAVNGQPQGPFTVQQLAQRGIRPNDMVWNDTMPNWVAASTIPELQSLFGYSAPEPAYKQPYQQQPQQLQYDYSGAQRMCGFTEAFSRFFKNYANFSDRASRSEYWFMVLWNLIITFAAFLIGGVIGGEQGLGIALIILGIYCLVIFIPSLALAWRRMHDIGKGGGWYFINCVPYIGGLWWLILTLKDSEPFENRFGPVPFTQPEF